MPDADLAWVFPFNDGRQSIDVVESYVNAWAVRDGDCGPSLSITESYTTDYLILGDTFSFEAWWEMGQEPNDKNFDILFFHDNEWKFAGWDVNFDGSSNEWETLSFWVPQWARGLETQIKFVLADWGQTTDPTVYLRNISSSSAPVPEPSTILLLSTGLIALAGWGKNKFKHR
jgi:hypothetical protein